MTANNNKSYLSYLNKLSISYTIVVTIILLVKNLIMLNWLRNRDKPKSPKFKFDDRVRITKHKKILVKVTLKIGQEKHLLSILWNRWTCKIKDLIE